MELSEQKNKKVTSSHTTPYLETMKYHWKRLEYSSFRENAKLDITYIDSRKNRYGINMADHDKATS